MALLKKILDLFGKNTESDVGKDYQAQSKLTNIAINVKSLHNNNNLPMQRGTFDVIVVGVSFYQSALEKICGNRHVEGFVLFTQANIVPYNDNPHDVNAVRVEIAGEIVGHLSRKNASVWRSKMVSDRHSGVIKCPAKIVWDKSVYKEGGYYVLLELDLTLSDSKPETNIAQAPLALTNQPDCIEFFVNQLNRFELLKCKVGDAVNLWGAKGSKEIFIYKQGLDFGEGKIGICPDEFFNVISTAPDCEASIGSIYDSGCKIICRLLSKAEVDKRIENMKEVEEKEVQEKRQNLSIELEKKFSPKTSIKARFDIKRNYNLVKGDKLYLDIKGKKYYLLNPRQLKMNLLNHEKKKIGRICTTDIVLRIIKAHYNGYHFDINVISFDNHEYYPHAEIEIVPKK